MSEENKKCELRSGGEVEVTSHGSYQWQPCAWGRGSDINDHSRIDDVGMRLFRLGVLSSLSSRWGPLLTRHVRGILPM